MFSVDEITVEFHSPFTEEELDILEDVDFDHTDRIWFHTKNGKDVEFVKREKEKAGRTIDAAMYGGLISGQAAKKLSAITGLINGVPSAESKMYDKLLTRLREHYEWAIGNEWETPITLSDDLKEAADVIEELSAKYQKALNDLVKLAEPPKEET